MLQLQQVLRATAYGSAALALLSAGVSAYWTAGGTALLSTVGGDLEALARRGGTSALILGAGTTAAKLAAVALSLSLVRPLGRSLGRRVVTRGARLAPNARGHILADFDVGDATLGDQPADEALTGAEVLPGFSNAQQRSAGEVPRFGYPVRVMMEVRRKPPVSLQDLRPAAVVSVRWRSAALRRCP